MMLAAPVLISRNTKPGDLTLMMSQEVARGLNLDDGDEVVLNVGRSQSPLAVKVAEKAGRSIQISPAVLQRLHLPAARRYSINARGHSLALGPVVGIMHRMGGDLSRPFDRQTQFIKELIIEGTRLGELCFGFDPRRIDFAGRTVAGCTWYLGRWRRGIFPIPDVVYPRDGSYSMARPGMHRRLNEMGCKFINPPLMGKWQTYRILSGLKGLTEHVPETRRVNGFHQIERMLLKHGAVYIKPINGSMGRNIIKVNQGRNGGYRYQYKVDYQSHTGYAGNRGALRRELKRIMRNHGYIVQQQINLLRVNGGIGDVRVMVQKDGSGNWSVAGKAFRIGPPGSITSNISGGGRGGRVNDVLRCHFPDAKGRELIAGEIDRLAVEVARALEDETGAIGELGIDIGIDVGGKVWFIEANLKPARRVFILIGERLTRRLTVRNPMLYARHLAGFNGGEAVADADPW